MVSPILSEFVKANASFSSTPIRPFDTMPTFDVQKHWDGDSTPAALAELSRTVAAVLPNSGARTPVIEAAIFMASLMHDCGYYYGGTAANRAEVDELFRKQIVYFATMLDPTAADAATRTAAVDEVAVQFGGGRPFDEPYSWSFGFEDLAERGYRPLAAGQEEKIRKHKQNVFRDAVRAITTQPGAFGVDSAIEPKLSTMKPVDRRATVEQINRLCSLLNARLNPQDTSNDKGWQPSSRSLNLIPGFET